MLWRKYIAILLALPLIFGACAPEQEQGLQLPFTFPPRSLHWLDVPWPSDFRRNSQGNPSLISFPAPQASEMLRSAVSLAEKSTGFALQPTLYVELGTALDAQALAADPERSLMPMAPVQLLALSGPLERRPLQLSQGGADDWLPPTALQARPLLGWPLSPNTQYALVLTRDLRSHAGESFVPVPEVVEGLQGNGPLAAHLAPLKARLADYQIAQDAILHASVFTSADPGAELRRVVAAQEALPAPFLQTGWLPGDAEPSGIFENRYFGYLWQHGDKPYATEGGGFELQGGQAQLASDEEPMTLAIRLPAGEPPPGGWPVVIYQHGTGGTFRSFLNGSGSFARNLAEQGIAMVGINQPLHGNRGGPGTNVEWHTFNPVNLEASAANLRQGALDLLLLRRMIAEGRLGSDQPPIALDPQRIFFFGHSQGGLSGALALPHLDELPCAVLSGAGAGLTLTLLERKEPIDFAEALKGWGGSQSDLFAAHPMISLMQHAFEPSDPISAAPHWQRRSLHHLFLTSGRLDQQTPASSADAMAMAALIPQIEPVVEDLWRHELEGVLPMSGRIQDNAQAQDRTYTAGYRQSRQGDHFVIFNSLPLRRSVTRFFAACADGEARLQSP
jgi:predicted esterase